MSLYKDWENLLDMVKAQEEGAGEYTIEIVEAIRKIEKTISRLPKGPVRLPGNLNWKHDFCYWYDLHEETAAAQGVCRAAAEPREAAIWEK